MAIASSFVLHMNLISILSIAVSSENVNENIEQYQIKITYTQDSHSLTWLQTFNNAQHFLGTDGQTTNTRVTISNNSAEFIFHKNN